MVDIVDIRKRVRLTIEQSRKYAQERRDRVASVERESIAVLEHVVTPVFRAVAVALKAEGYLFRVLTPAGSVRLVTETKEDNFIELRLDSMRDPPVLMARVSRVWGRRVLVDDKTVRDAASIANWTEDEVLVFLLREIQPFVER